MALEFLTVGEAALEADVSPQRILNRISRKKIKAKKRGWMWTISRTEFNRFKKSLKASTLKPIK